MSSVGVGQGLAELDGVLAGLAVPQVMREAIGVLVAACAVHADLGQGQAAGASRGGSSSGGEGDSGGSGTGSSVPQSLVRGGQVYSSLVVPEEGQWADGAVLDTVVAAQRVQGWAESLSLLAVRALTARTAVELLARQGVLGEEELSSATGVERLRTATRAAVRLELSALAGWSRAGCNERIGLATAPSARAGFALAQLGAGAVGWERVRVWANRTAVFGAVEAGQVAGVCLDPAAGGGAARVDPESGQVVGRALSDSQFRAVLEREAVRVEGGRPASARARRRAELSGRDLFTRLFEHGVGQMSLRGDGPALAAAASRIDDVARRLRAAGDARSLAAIRADTALALLGHGQLPTSGSTATSVGHGATRPGSGCAGEPVGPVVGDLEQMARVLAGTPAAHVELVVPLEVLTGAEAAVVEVSGYGSITPEHAREILLTAGAEGTTIHRLLTDPVEGRCLERSTGMYRPDRAMIAQLRAVDGTCRAPGCTVPAAACDLDHEIPYNHDDPAAGGPTAEVNLNHKHRLHHWGKTERLWSTAMDALSRTVTWTSLFGRCYTTRAKDYRTLGPPSGAGRPPGRQRSGPRGRRDSLRTVALHSAGFVVKHYQQPTMSALTDLLDAIYYTHDPTLGLPQAMVTLPLGTRAGHAGDDGDGASVSDGTDTGEASEPVPVSDLLYAAIADHHRDNPGLHHPYVQVDQVMPVELAHHHGAQTRHGPHRHTPDLTTFVTRPGTEPTSAATTPTPDPDEPPPF